MHSKKPSCLSLVVASMLLPGCGPSTNALRNNRAADAQPHTVSQAALSGADAADKLAMSLLAELDHRPNRDGNMAFAPTSLSVALMMVAAGAGGETRSGMLTGLGFDASVSDPVAATAAIIAELTKTSDSPSTITAADRIWVQTGLQVKPAYLDALQSHFRSDAGRLDFINEPESARGSMNAWIAERTEGLVPELLGPNTIDTKTRLLAADAMVISAPWLTPFDPKLTSMKPFTTLNGVVQVQTMRQTVRIKYWNGYEVELAEMPLAGNRLVLDIILPSAGKGPVSAALAAASIKSLVAATPSPKIVAIELPQFSTTSALRLDKELSSLGMAAAFSDHADFTGITTDETLSIGGVMQQVAVTINERGTRTGIGSGVILEHRMATPDPIEMHVNRPFLYVIRDRESGAFLVVGRVGDPTKA